jgi:hypothetical protein
MLADGARMKHKDPKDKKEKEKPQPGHKMTKDELKAYFNDRRSRNRN